MTGGDECTDAWTILSRINPQVTWTGEWGVATLANGAEVFISVPIDWTQHGEVDGAASVLGLSYAFCPDGRFAFAERARVWKERL